MTGPAKSFVFATAGHVDHGKSALIRSLTGIEPDRWDEEQRRGMTLDLGFAWSVLSNDVQVAFVDVPGHERFVSTMLAGAGSVPAVLFVVSADEGWSAQSSEHLQGLDALGVRDGILVITKSDLMDPELAEAEAREHLGESGLADIPSVAVSAATGAGLDDLRTGLARLVERLRPPDSNGDVRMWLDRAFTIRGAGTVVTGTLTDGTLRTGQDLELYDVHDASTTRVRIRALESAGSREESYVGIRRVAVNLRNVPATQAKRGSLLLTPDRFDCSNVVDARLHVSDLSAGLSVPQECTAHIGTAAVHCRVRRLDAEFVRVTLDTALPLRIGDRLVLRDPGRRVIFGSATVLDTAVPRFTRRGAATARAAALIDYGAVADARVLVRDRGIVRADELSRMGCADLPKATRGWCIDPNYLQQRVEQIVALIDDDLRRNPDSRGLSIETARQQLDLPHLDVLHAVLAKVPGAQVIDGFVVDERHTSMTPTLQEGLRKFMTTIADNPFHAPDAEALRELGLSSRELSALCRHGELVSLASGIYLTPETIDRSVSRFAEFEAPFTLGEAREALGTTRRVAVPLMEYLARVGRTKRVADGRHVVVAPIKTAHDAD
ncbi:selenocysteine-specific elongation factor [Antricoccus suffuscus]|uniref:Selenocysteine-specific elongation factor n=1 Tax=Antricoccus suffuscus TaxID=1629062 RepID=A0A2T1A4S0_9ACTN|nr:selenocysteine-specific translation elongation factor [Antricoccus suffuscus]PRZ43599.1 selenocysteine-specific elongation factor [Antricoccus suffuscus]